MAATQRAAATSRLALAGASPIRLLQHQRAALCLPNIHRRLLSGPSTTMRLGLSATARLRTPSVSAFASNSTPAPFTASLLHNFKRNYSTDPKLPTYFPPSSSPPPPNTSPARRMLRVMFKLLGATFALCLGYAVGGYLLLLKLRREGLRQKHYADEQVRLLKEGKIDEFANFQEPGAKPRPAAVVEKTAEILRYILGHPYVREHLEAPSALDGWELVDSVQDVAPANRLPADYLFFHMIRFFRENNMFTDVMASEHAMPVPPLTWRDDRGDELVMIAYTGKDLCGHENIVHGGFVATLLDEAMARCCFKTLPGNVGVTAYLNINYRAPTPAQGYIVIKAKTTKAEGRKAWVEARLETLPPANSGKAPRLLAEAEAMFVAPKEYTFVGKWLKNLGLYNNVGL